MERVLAQIASDAHGLVTHGQMEDSGITLGEIRWRLGTGALLREYPGVYRVGHRAPNVEARYLAAVLACGEGAVLSGRAAGWLWGLLKGPAPPAEVTAPTERHVKGVRTTRARRAKREATKCARHPGDQRGPDPGRPGCCLERSAAGARLPRSRRPSPHHPGRSRHGSRATTAQPGGREAAADHARRHPRHSQQTRVALPGTPESGRATAPADQPAPPAAAASTAAGRTSTSPSN